MRPTSGISSPLCENSDRFMGINVTVPHKVRIMDFLDELDAGAERVQAVNTVVKNFRGQADRPQHRRRRLRPKYPHGATGTGRKPLSNRLKEPTSCFWAPAAQRERLRFMCPITWRAESLSSATEPWNMRSPSLAELRKMGRNAIAIGEAEVSAWAPKVGLIINSTTKGQGGLRKLSHDEVTTLEPFSSLAPARPRSCGTPPAAKRRYGGAGAHLPAQKLKPTIKSRWRLPLQFPSAVGFYDLIYHPEETVFLRHGRLTGHPTMNGKAMIINQAVIALCKHVCSAELRARGIDNAETSRGILEVMYPAW